MNNLFQQFSSVIMLCIAHVCNSTQLCLNILFVLSPSCILKCVLTQYAVIYNI